MTSTQIQLACPEDEDAGSACFREVHHQVRIGIASVPLFWYERIATMIDFTLNDRSGVPIYRQIQDQVRFGIASGRLRPGEQLPTVRALAVELSVNPNTVTKAYTELEREGIVTTEQGTGTFVASPPVARVPESDRREKLEALCMEFLAHAGAHGFTSREVVQTLRTLNERK